MRSLIFASVLGIALCVLSCNDEDSPSGVAQFTNKLTLGTGANASNSAVTGETTSFNALGGVAVIYWRLESVEDFNGAGVSLKIEKLSAGTPTLIGIYPSVTSRVYGHVVVSSISLADAGSFRATGILNATSTDVASTTFTVQW